ncbi:MAG: class I SAM-dependent methyltransferase [Actinomycetota bacterium]|nr:class I SAM-dependent methyltransferase [Actinomycetota bacterium]
MDAAEVSKLALLEDRHWWYRERRWLLARELERLTGPPGVAVDIGAAGGGNTRVLREHGWRELVVEYGEEGARTAASRGLRTIRADGTALPLRAHSVDLLVAFDVLEHIDDDRAAAGEIARVLRPGGTLLVAVPCDMALWSAHDEAVGHFRRYDRNSLRHLIVGAGLAVEELRSWNVLLRPVVRLRRRGSTESDLTELHPVVNAGLTTIIRAERHLPVGGRKGVSLLLRARRPLDPKPA